MLGTKWHLKNILYINSARIIKIFQNHQTIGIFFINLLVLESTKLLKVFFDDKSPKIVSLYLGIGKFSWVWPGSFWTYLSLFWPSTNVASFIIKKFFLSNGHAQWKLKTYLMFKTFFLLTFATISPLPDILCW